MKAVKSLTMSNTTQKMFTKIERKASKVVEPDTAALARRVLKLLEMDFIKNPDFSYKWKSGKNSIYHDLFIRLTVKAREVVQEEPSFLELSSPIYVFGDIHGNYTDLMRFSKMMGMHKAPRAMPARYLFLGDYVDRGEYSVEVIAYLLAMKVLYPKRIFLLRGNHELQTTNCSYQSYGDKCFHGMCTKAYGKENGNNVWWSVQYVFKNLPLAASIDKSVFCTHGGIPRIIGTDPDVNVVKMIKSIKRPWDTDFDVKLEEFLRNKENQLVFDLLWSDPAIDPIDPDDGEEYPKGFGKSNRGPGSCVFSMEALNEFYAKTAFTHIIRAHEAVCVNIKFNEIFLFMVTKLKISLHESFIERLLFMCINFL